MLNQFKYKIGIDEVGRGPIAGPVAVCSTFFCIDDEIFLKDKLKGINDSKKLSEKKREFFFNKIKKENKKIFSSVVFISAKNIDKFGIVPSIFKALNKSLENIFIDEKIKKIKKKDIKIFLDGGLKAPNFFINQETIIKGDEKEFSISVASVIAKVMRDNRMKKYGKRFPEYFFEKHKGYGTKKHIEIIQKKGICEIHRKSFLKFLG